MSSRVRFKWCCSMSNRVNLFSGLGLAAVPQAPEKLNRKEKDYFQPTTGSVFIRYFYLSKFTSFVMDVSDYLIVFVNFVHTYTVAVLKNKPTSTSTAWLVRCYFVTYANNKRLKLVKPAVIKSNEMVSMRSCCQYDYVSMIINVVIITT